MSIPYLTVMLLAAPMYSTILGTFVLRNLVVESMPIEKGCLFLFLKEVDFFIQSIGVVE